MHRTGLLPIGMSNATGITLISNAYIKAKFYLFSLPYYSTIGLHVLVFAVFSDFIYGCTSFFSATQKKFLH